MVGLLATFLFNSCIKIPFFLIIIIKIARVFGCMEEGLCYKHEKVTIYHTIDNNLTFGTTSSKYWKESCILAYEAYSYSNICQWLN